MFPDIILLVLSLVMLIIASIADLKTKEVPDWVSYSLIFSAFMIRLIASVIYTNYLYFLYGIIGFSIMFILGTLFYYTRQWGGGDTKLLTALGVVFASKPYFVQETKLPFLILLLFNILILGAFYGLIWSFVLILKNWQRFVIRFKIRFKNPSVKFWEKIIAALLAVNIAIMFLSKDNFTRFLLITSSFLIVIYFYLWIAVRSIESLSMYKVIPTERLTEGDWVAKDVYKKDELIYKTNSGISKEDIKNLINANIKKVTIKEGIPFVPPFLIGVIISILTGKILFLI